MMNRTGWLILSVVAMAMCSNAGEGRLMKAEVQDPNLPKVLLIGDSILGGYRFTVGKQLAGKATVDIWGNPYNQAANSWHSELKGVLSSNGPYAVIHFNIGLHGWKKGLIPEGQFEPLTSKCVETIRQYAPGAKIIWASTTPVVTTNRPFALDPAINSVIVEHNAMAARVMQKYGIPINDLYTLMAPRVSLSHGDGFHWDGEAYTLMGEAVVRAIEAQLQPKTQVKVQPFSPADVRLLDGPFRENQVRDINYLLSIDPDRFLHMFRVTAGLPSTAKPLGGWERPECWVRGQTMGHYLTACALMYAATGDERLKSRADALVAELAKCQAALQKKGSNPGYLSAFPEEFFDNLDANKQVWSPWYVVHKMMAGLLDMNLYAGNRQAMDVLTRMADWVMFRVDRRTEAQMQQSLKMEFGGMGEVLANLYAVTNNPDYLRLARCFDHKAVYDPLAAGEDKLNGEHGNSMIPKIIGASREYELTGEQRYRDIAEYFWRNVALKRSFVHGGNSDREHFFPAEEFSKHLSPMAAESCNTYNMLKLTRNLFGWEPSAEKMDFYEKALFNHILGSQDPVKGTTIYFASTRPGFFKLYAMPFDAFWCCTGTGMENPARYGESIYFHNDRELYVNLFVASRLTWADKGLVVTQDTRFPEQDAARLTLSCKQPVALAIKIRWPAWATNGMTVAVNGKPQEIAGRPGSYVAVERTWQDGDRLDVRLPMTLRTEAMPDDPNTVALLYGPIVLAGELGGDNVTSNGCYLMSNESGLWMRVPEVPIFIGDAKNIPAHIEPVPGQPLTFRSVGVGRPNDVSLIPYYRMHHQRFTVYWKLCTEAQWRDIAARREKAAIERKQLEPRIVDEILFGDGRNEYEHKLQGVRRSSEAFQNRIWCESARSATGFFSFVLKVKPDRPMRLQCTYWGAETEFTVGMFTGRMSPTGPRAFDILVDDKKIAEQKLTPNDGKEEFFDVEYPIPEELTRGKERVVVKFQAHKDGIAGRLFECMMLEERADK